jgi:hypothetical protein
MVAALSWPVIAWRMVVAPLWVPCGPRQPIIQARPAPGGTHTAAILRGKSVAAPDRRGHITTISKQMMSMAENLMRKLPLMSPMDRQEMAFAADCPDRLLPLLSLQVAIDAVPEGSSLYCILAPRSEDTS